ncbi:MAG TPA: EamA family transporter [Azospirillum sp.]|nr:EamA family transporter [Azospirillum sp.]
MATLGNAFSDRQNPALTGLAAALGAFLLWGLVAPVYFKALTGVGPVEIVAHRVVWTVLLVGALVLATRGPAAILCAVGSWRRLGIFAVTTALVSANWVIFIYAILSNQILQSSLGYYINPLVNVLLGVVFLHERLSRQQVTAVLIAAAGVLSLVVWYGVIRSADDHFQCPPTVKPGRSMPKALIERVIRTKPSGAVRMMPWIALSLAVTFGVYALVRKKAAIDPIIGLLVETALLVPPAVGYLLWLGADGAFMTRGIGQDLLLVLSGPMTAVPLMLFMVGAARLKLSPSGCSSTWHLRGNSSSACWSTARRSPRRTRWPSAASGWRWCCTRTTLSPPTAPPCAPRRREINASAPARGRWWRRGCGPRRTPGRNPRQTPPGRGSQARS